MSNDRCRTCDGCGRIADDDEGSPWSFWEQLPPGSDLAVRMGAVRPVTCPECGGTGSAAVDAAVAATVPEARGLKPEASPSEASPAEGVGP